MNSLVAILVSITLVVSSLLQSVAFAQSNSRTGFPVLEVPVENPSDPYTFEIDVTDDGAIDTVALFYRYSTGKDYRQLNMSNPRGDRRYVTRLPKADRTDGTIQHYFVATDRDGNTSTVGFVFNPLSRSTNVSVNADAAASGVSLAKEPSSQVRDQPGPVGDAPRKKNTVLYVILGALAVGALAGLASSGGGGGGNTDDCSNIDGGCTVTITFPTLGN